MSQKKIVISTRPLGFPWPEQEQTYGKRKGRFALHADGKEELKY